MTKKTKRKALGQHFLKNKTVLNKILRRISPQKKDLIIEIGAGRGVMTFPLAEKAGKVIAIEKDPALIPYLQRRDFPNLTILEKDIMKVEFCELLKHTKNFKENVKLVGNLPYSLSSPLLFKLLEERELFSECIFLLQKEVAQRLCVSPARKSTLHSPSSSRSIFLSSSILSFPRNVFHLLRKWTLAWFLSKEEDDLSIL